jgi:hypothetical protein
MADEELARLRSISKRYRQAEKLRPDLHRAIYAALLAGVTVATVAQETGYNREHIRRIRMTGDEGKL